MEHDEHDLERMADTLLASGRYVVLRRMERTPALPAEVAAVRRTALIVDVETTGLDPERDRIIQLSAQPFEYCPRTGRVLSAGAPLTCFEDPGIPIPAEVTAITRIRDADVAGTRIDDAAVAALAASAGLVIAHNAGFDRRFVERRFPCFREMHWACSMSEVPWEAEGLSSAKLEFLVFKHCGMFFAGHRADHDCLATLHLLATPFASGGTPLLALLRSARRKTVRLWATGAPMEAKGVLRARRYSWNPGESGGHRAWFRDVPEDREAEECAWLAAEIYGGRAAGWQREEFDARRRYSEGRVG